MKKQLREYFSIEIKNETHVGPCEVEITEEQYEQNIHKFEPDDADTKNKSKPKPKPVEKNT